MQLFDNIWLLRDAVFHHRLLNGEFKVAKGVVMKKQSLLFIPVLVLIAMCLAACASVDAKIFMPLDTGFDTSITTAKNGEVYNAGIIRDADFIEYLMNKMTIEERIGQLFMLRIRQTTVTTATRNLLASIPAGGVILFAENISYFSQVQALTQELQELSAIPLLIATDEEGGRVSRVGRLFEHGRTPAALQIGLGNVPRPY